MKILILFLMLIMVSCNHNKQLPWKTCNGVEINPLSSCGGK